MSAANEFINRLVKLVGKRQVRIKKAELIPYTHGFRVGHGQALAVIIPRSLLQMWQVLQACVEQDAIIIIQAANTGVTGGSTPHGADYDREVVILSMRKLTGVQLIDEARQVIAFPGTTLTMLENALKPHGREPHSVIGSSCIGASVIGGICNNSGGSLLRRGPAFTEKSLFAQIDEQGQLQLVNHLGIELGDTPESILSRLERGAYQTGDQPDWTGRLWAEDYAEKLRQVDSSQPLRFNGHPAYLHESSGSCGKLAVFAVRLPSFTACEKTTTFYLGTHNERALLELRRALLSRLKTLPLQAEYIHRHAFELTIRYAKHVYKAIVRLGTDKIPELFAAKNRWDRWLRAIPLLPNHTSDIAIQWFNRLTSSGVEPRIMDFHRRYPHHLLIKTESAAQQELEALLRELLAPQDGAYFACSDAEEKNAFLIRFGVGVSPIYYCKRHHIDTEQRLISFDFALRANDPQWRLELPPKLQQQVLKESCCGHFFCLVNHQDYLLKPGCDPVAFKHDVLELLAARGAKYPAEHNLGHVYHASGDYQRFFRQLDPTNSFNPGIGLTSKRRGWQ